MKLYFNYTRNKDFENEKKKIILMYKINRNYHSNCETDRSIAAWVKLWKPMPRMPRFISVVPIK